MNATPEKERHEADKFAQEAAEQQMGIVREFWDFLLHNKKWWITPIIIVLLLVAVLVAISASPMSPFIYTFF